MSEQAIAALLQAKLAPSVLELKNESAQHAGYVAGKESHFRLVVVSEQFCGMPVLARHRLIYDHLGQFLTRGGGSVHALAIHAYTPSEWTTLSSAPASPTCANAH